MKLCRLHAADTAHLPPASVVTIGNFDGVHLGHQAMIARLTALAAEHRLHSVVMLFEPQPLEFLRPEQAPPRISSLREKVAMLRTLGVDVVAIARFNQNFRDLSAEQFARLLRQQLNAQILVLGDDFHFGKNRQGDSDFLRAQGFEVINLATVRHQQARISSTRVRDVLQQGDFAAARDLLGRPYQICGRVLHGDKIGRTLDFPTLNIALQRPKPCLHGIYAVEVSAVEVGAVHDNLATRVAQQNPQQRGIAGFSPHSLIGAASVGTRPSVTARADWRLEVHLMDVAADLYGQLLQVTFLDFLHGERHYPSLDSLKDGIADDVQQIRRYRAERRDFPL